MKYIPSLMVGQLAGSAGSTTASHNKYGSYFRTRVTPVNTETTKRSAVRSAFGGWSNQWKALTTGQRDSWNALASTVTLQDKQGVSFQPSGFNLFVSANQNNYGLSAAVVDDAPAWDPPAAPVISNATFEEETGILAAASVTFSPTAPTGVSYVWEASPPMSPGVSMVPRSLYKRVGITVPAGTSPTDVSVGYETTYGTSLPVGTKVFIRGRAIDEATGQASPWAYFTTIVVTGA
jgi:hypothetical protein